MAASAASSSSYQGPPGGWSWPEDLAAGTQPSTSSSEQPSSQPRERKPTQPELSSSERPSHPHQQQEQQQRQRQNYYRPRNCRICLETVQPTYNPPSEHIPGLFQGSPNVTYESEGGRLIRPCKCKGSSRYVHDQCLQQWRHADPSYGRRNFWQCPTCGFKYRLERMRWGQWISSKVAQIGLTLVIFFVAVFLLGYVADPIINLYFDPFNTITSLPNSSTTIYEDLYDDEPATWVEHFAKGITSLGLIGFIKYLFTLSPWQWFNFRTGYGGVRRAGQSGRDRMANISWVVVILGVMTMLYTVWKGVRAWSRRVLEKAGERVMDVQGDNDDDDDDYTD